MFLKSRIILDMNKKYFSLIPAVSILIITSHAVYAVEKQNTNVGRVVQNVDKWAEQTLKWKEKFKAGANLPIDLEERTNKIKEQRDKICKNTQDRVNERWTKYYEKRMNRVESMDKGIKSLEKIIEFYKSKGLNTANLEADLVALKALVGEYKTEYLKFLDALEVAKTLPCANHEGEFLPKLKAAKDQWLVVKQKAESIRDYYQGTVKKHLEELRTQLPVKKKINGTEDK